MRESMETRIESSASETVEDDVMGSAGSNTGGAIPVVYHHERIDDLQRSNLKIIQDPSRFCFGMDAVLLSGFAHVKPGELVLDIGTGTGIIPLLLSAKTKGKHFTGLEIQPAMADMASRSVAYNHLEDRIDIVCGDVRESEKLWKGGTWDVITCNPPYMNESHGLQNPDDALAIARHEICCSLGDVVRESARMLKSRGRMYMVHRPHRLIDIIDTMRRYKLEPKTMQMVHPFADKEANMVLIEAVKDGGAHLHVPAPIIVYESQGVYTKAIREIYGY